MTMTPWGEAAELRDRMMVSGPRASPEEAALNQRERLFGAIVALCAERGYGGTTIADLTALSGVSRRDFYRHFPDKEGCFLATMDALLEAGQSAALARSDGSGAGLEVLIRICAVQPAATRFCLLESYVAGPAAVARMDGAVALAEDAYAAALKAAGHKGQLPRELCPAVLGGIREVVQNRLLEGREGEITELAPALRNWAFDYRPPPASLPRPRPRAGAPGSYLPEDPAERIIAALSAVVAERGYQDTRVDEIVARAGVSLSTFYAHFDGKESVLVAALDAGRARLTGVALPPYRRARDWPSAVRAAFEAMFAFFAAEPAYARLAMVEVYAAGGAGLARRGRMIRSLEGFLDPGFERRPELPRVLAEAIGGATGGLVQEQIRRSGVEALPSLAPLATYLTLAPFLGAVEAAEVARRRR